MTIGILGGGQLGRMLALAGIPLGLSFRFLDPTPDSPAREVGDLVVGDFDDPKALRRFAKGLSIVTFEFENVPVASVERLAAMDLDVFPNARSLRTAQDRILEKQLFEREGIAVPPYAAIDSQADLDAAVERLGLPAVLKTRRMGYDGKGQKVLRRPEDVRGAVAELSPHASKPNAKKNSPSDKKGTTKRGIQSGAGLIVERFVKFEREVSMIAVAARDGSIATYPLTENVHKGGILRTSTIPASSISPSAARRADAAVRRVVASLGYVGVLAIEFFVHNGELLGNEMAPRVHNSGHWTIDGAVTCQFENHLRAILGLPLGSTAARGPCVMHNLIGTVPPTDAMLAIDGAKLHLYGKEPRAGRKLGHITAIGSDAAVPKASKALATLIDKH